MFTDTETAIPADTAHAAFVRAVVSAAADLSGILDENRIYDLMLIATEAITNAVEVQQEEGMSAPIEVRCRVTSEKVTLVIRDQGPGFDPHSLSELPSPESPERLQYESGLGFTLMKILTDGMEIQSGPNGTVVHLVLRAASPEVEEQA